MADNFLEYQREAFEARKAKKERERKKRLRKYLEDYKKETRRPKIPTAAGASPNRFPPTIKGIPKKKS